MSASDYHNDIQKLYIAYFNRPADPLGLEYWAGQIEAAGGSLAGIATAFATSSEYQAQYGNKSSAEVVAAIYQNLFGRAPELDGLLYWSTRLDNGTFSIGNIVQTVMMAAQGSDATVIDNKVTAAVAFTTALDTNEEITAYSGDRAVTIARAFLAQVTDSTASVSDLLATTTKAVKEIVGGNTDTGTSTPALVFSAALDNGEITFTNPGSAITMTVTEEVDDEYTYTFTSSGTVSGTDAIITLTHPSAVVVPSGTTLTVDGLFAQFLTFSGAGTVKVSSGGTFSSSVLDTIEDNVAGIADVTNFTKVTGSIADLLPHLVTNQGTTIRTAANVAVDLDDTSASAADINAIDAATTGLVSADSITGVTGTAAAVKTALIAHTADTALSLDALNAVTLTTGIAASDLDNVVFARDTTLTLANASNNLTLVNGTVGNTRTLTIDGSAMTGSNALYLNASAEADGMLHVTGGAGDDIVEGSVAFYRFDGGAGVDTYRLVESAHVLNGSSNDDFKNVERIDASTASAGVTITLGGHDEGFTITGSAHNDSLGGSTGDDVFVGFVGADSVDGGAGTDTLRLDATSATLNAADDNALQDIEKIDASTANAGVTITLSAQTEGFTITGGSGGDVISGGSGSDTFNGGLGNDEYVFGSSNRSTLANMDTIEGYRWTNTDDFITISDLVATYSQFSGYENIITAGHMSLEDNLDEFAFNNVVDNAVIVFEFESDIYVYIESFAGNNSFDSSDFVLRLSGNIQNFDFDSISSLGIDGLV